MVGKLQAEGTVCPRVCQFSLGDHIPQGRGEGQGCSEGGLASQGVEGCGERPWGAMDGPEQERAVLSLGFGKVFWDDLWREDGREAGKVRGKGEQAWCRPGP